MERVEIDFEGDVADANASIQSMIRILDRLEGQAIKTGRATDDIGVEFADDVAETEALTQSQQRLERQLAATNREMMKQAGLSFVPGGAGGGGSWQRPGGGPEDARSAAYTTRPTFTFDDLNRARMNWAPPPGFAGSGGPYIPSQSGGGRSSTLGQGILGSVGGFDGGGGRRGGGGFGIFGAGDQDGKFQLGDLTRGILPGAQRAGPGALGILGAGAVGLGGQLGPAGALGALGGAAVFSSLAANIAVLATAFSGLGDAIDGDKEAFDKLTPSTQAFVQTVRGFIPELQGLQEMVRAGVLPGAAEGLTKLFSPEMISALEKGLGAVSKGLGDQLSKAGGFLGSPEEAAQLQAFLTNSVGWTDNLTDATLQLFDAFTTLLTAGAPFVDWMTDGIARGAEWVNTMVDQKVATGEFADLMSRGQAGIESLGDAIGSILGFLKELADVMDGPVGNALEMAGDGLDELARMLERNGEEIENFINSGLKALADAIGLLWPIFTTTIEGINAVVEAFGGWELAFEIILGAVVLTKFATLAGAIGGVGAAAGLAAAEGGGIALLASRLKLAAGWAVALKIGMDKLFDVFDRDLNEDSNRIGVWIVDQLPIPDSWKDALNSAPGGAKIDPKTGKVVADVNPDTNPDAKGPGVSQKGSYAMPAPTSWANPGAGHPGGKTGGLGGSGWVGPSDQFGYFAVPDNPVGAPVDGVLLYYNVDGASAPGGDTLQFKGDDGYTYFMSHLRRPKGMKFPKAGDRVAKGTPLGVIAGSKNGKFKGAPHLHIDKANSITLAAGGGSGGGSSPWSGGAPAWDPDKASAAPAIPSGDDLLTDAERERSAAAERTVQRGKLVRMKGTNLSYRAPDTFQDDIDEKLDQINRLKKQMAKTPKGELRTNLAEQIANLYGDIKTLTNRRKADAEQALNDLEAILKRRLSRFKAAFDELRSTMLSEFDRVTRDFIAPSAQIAAAERKAYDDAALQRQLEEAEKALADAKTGKGSADAGRIVKEAQSLLGQYALANEIDKAQSAVLGIAAQDQFGEQFANEMRDLLNGTAAGGVDNKAIADAEQRLADIKFTIRQRSLAELADAEEKAWVTRRERERKELEASLEQWASYYERLVRLGMNPTRAAGAAVHNAGLAGNPVAADVAAAAFKSGSWTPGEGAPYFDPSSLGFFAEGGIATRPTLGVFGERGPEALIPLSDPRYQGMMGGANVQVTIADGMSWLEQFVDVRVTDNVEGISQAIGQSADTRYREGRV